jgi:hypothetical protein
LRSSRVLFSVIPKNTGIVPKGLTTENKAAKMVKKRTIIVMKINYTTNID